MRRLKSGSTPHDVVIADPAPLRSAPFPPALARQRTRLRRSATPPGDRTANPVEQRAIRSFAPARAPKIQAKAIRSPASPQPPKHSRRRQIPIAPAALSVPHTPRFPALALFGRRPPERVDDLCIPASENLHTSRSRSSTRRSFGLFPKGVKANSPGGSGKDQPAIYRRAASALPTTTKYLAMGTADTSRDLSNPGQPMTATSDHTHAARQIDWGDALPHRAFTEDDDTATRGNSPSPFPKRRLLDRARPPGSYRAPFRLPVLQP